MEKLISNFAVLMMDLKSQKQLIRNSYVFLAKYKPSDYKDIQRKNNVFIKMGSLKQQKFEFIKEQILLSMTSKNQYLQRY